MSGLFEGGHSVKIIGWGVDDTTSVPYCELLWTFIPSFRLHGYIIYYIILLPTFSQLVTMVWVSRRDRGEFVGAVVGQRWWLLQDPTWYRRVLH
eukprot:COSAG01_NODE_1757_length_9317_cov_3.510089_5_plen_94_part_00